MILEGARLAEKIIGALSKLSAPKGKLVVVQVGADPVSTLYVAKKKELARRLGVDFRLLQLPAEIQQVALEAQLKKLSGDPTVRAVLLHLPLPVHLDQKNVAQKISPRQDLDGFSCILGRKHRLIPPTVLAINELLDFYRIEKNNKKILIVGGGFLVGKPLAEFWRKKGFPAEILEKDDPEYQKKLKEAEIVIVATGGKRRFSAADFSCGATVIDASTVSDDGKIRGDVEGKNWPSNCHLAGVPGGIGPVTVAILMRNFYSL